MRPRLRGDAGDAAVREDLDPVSQRDRVEELDAEPGNLRARFGADVDPQVIEPLDCGALLAAALQVLRGRADDARDEGTGLRADEHRLAVVILVEEAVGDARGHALQPQVAVIHDARDEIPVLVHRRGDQQVRPALANRDQEVAGLVDARPGSGRKQVLHDVTDAGFEARDALRPHEKGKRVSLPGRGPPRDRGGGDGENEKGCTDRGSASVRHRTVSPSGTLPGHDPGLLPLRALANMVNSQLSASVSCLRM